MKQEFRTIGSAAVTALIIVAMLITSAGLLKDDYKSESVAKEASGPVIKEYLHDNYIISEKNPWTDYSIHPVDYKEDIIKKSLKVKAKSAVLIDVENQSIVYGKNENARRAPASTTKLMTALTVLQYMNPNDIVEVGSEVYLIAPDSSKAGFGKGQITTVGELMHGMLMASGNDAAYILAKSCGLAIFQDSIENDGKSFSDEMCVERFVLEMNKNVRSMGLSNTHFTSPDGYDDKNQYTSASDLSKIAYRAYENKTIASICGKETMFSKSVNKTWENTNQLFNKQGKYFFKYCKGLKTGTTDAAGKCFVSVGKNKYKTCISVVLGENSDDDRWSDSIKILKAGLN